MILVKGGYICAVIRVHVDDLNGERAGASAGAAATAATSFPVPVGRSVGRKRPSYLKFIMHIK